MIDSKLQARLRERFNPDGSDLRRAQLRMLEMLKYIDRICSENSLKYWLSSGTCLGAVRHGGFIPWDDDVDIEMPRTDYKRFIKIVNSRNDDFKVQYGGNDPDFDFPFAKLRDLKSITHEDANKSTIFKGLFIDIFIMDYGTKFSRHLAGHLYARLVYPYSQMVLPSGMSYSRRKKLFHDVNHFLLKSILYPALRLIEKPFINRNKLRHELGICFFMPRNIHDIFPLKKIPFENTMVYAPGNADSYLAGIYGDYMRLPDIESIHPHYSKVEFLD